MKFFGTALAVAPLLITEAAGIPSRSSILPRQASVPLRPSILPRQASIPRGLVKGIELILEIIGLIDPQHGAWEYEEFPNACSFKVYTHNGSNCEVTTACEGYEKVYPNGTGCHVGGVQFYNDEQVGEFTVTWNGVERETLGMPVVAFKAIGDLAPWDLPELTRFSDDQKKSSNPQQRVCNNLPEGFSYSGTKGGELIYECGVPKLGKRIGDIYSNMPENENGYAPGWCGMHVTQHQKPDPSKDKYRFDVKLFDVNENLIGEVLDQVADKIIEVPSKLPHVMLVEAGNVDNDAVLFKYAEQHFGSNDQAHHCNFGAYDNMKREGDCGFTC
jgi:hypothetical protein